MMVMLFILLILSMGKVQLMTVIEQTVPRLHLALANGITSNPVKLCS